MGPSRSDSANLARQDLARKLLAKSPSVIMSSEEPETDLYELFHENTKMRRHDRTYAARVSFISKNPDLQKKLKGCFKRYDGVPRIELPEEFPSNERTFDKAVTDRRSVREFSGHSLTLGETAKLLHFANGVTGELTGENGEVLRYLRTSPSGGGLYPVEMYFVPVHADDIDSGLYHYYPKDHELELLRGEEVKSELIEASPYPDIIESAGGVVVLSGMFERSTFKYENRGYRFVLFEAGHIAQNLCLTATALGLGSVALGGFIDCEVENSLGLDGVDESVLYMVAVGSPAGH